jgi:type II secretory pathway pseudopilin PulG
MKSQTLIAHPNTSAQRGYALIATIALVGIASTAFLVTSLSATALKNQQDRQTSAALAMAKQALVGYAASDADMPGVLPCPDTDNDGTADAPCGAKGTTAIGRLPWKTLDLPALRDSAGECLWYAVSGNFKNSGTSAPDSINSDSPGTLAITNTSGASIAAANTVTAIIFAPGKPLEGQDRTPPQGGAQTVCGGNVNASNYLDSNNNINNATGNGAANLFVIAQLSDQFDDQLAYLTTTQLFSTVGKRVTSEVLSALKAAPENTPISDILGPQTKTDPQTGNQVTTQSWFDANGWRDKVSYSEGTLTIIKDEAVK